MTTLFHQVVVDADSDAAYEACRNVSNWPIFMPAVRAARFVEATSDHDVVEITAEANNAIWTWQSRRKLDPLSRTIEFDRIDPPPSVVSMSGKWRIISINSIQSTIELHHHYVVSEGENEMEDFLARSIRSNASRDLQALAKYLPSLTP